MTSYPPDGHVHTQFSWDAPFGNMERTCARAVELGLPSIAFTEHADFGRTILVDSDPTHLPGWLAAHTDEHGVVTPPDLAVENYLAEVARCRELFPGLRILTGVELSEPHWHARRTADLIDLGGFDRILGSVHNLRHVDDRTQEVREYDSGDAYRVLATETVIRSYLAEVEKLATGSDAFGVLAHIDFPVRYWPSGAAPFDPATFEEEYRVALRALARSGRALEVNTRVPLDPVIVRWWYQEGGETLTFGSDAHRPDDLANGLREAAAMVETIGFRPGAHPYDLWRR
ncbi:PHP domain-containing protein [Cryptosporangium phraense]|uniref:Histidinol-phosphatase n=1 Tax=Cryptosporangium phraense TaxID=2593070 RepID=A0A545AED1_9ACTN|nr:PHP domain-containing protein [Cryptosporangium phraense]TQS39673.1 PHP domain-containing protein [Cryptosporangium phraense]